MRWTQHLAILGAILAAFVGCYKATFVNPDVAPGIQVEEWTDFFVFGVVGHEEIDVRRFCPGEVAQIRTGGNVGTDVITLITLGIYAPRKVYVTCAGNPGPLPASTMPPPVAPSTSPPSTVPPAPPPPVTPLPTVEIDLSPAGRPLHVAAFRWGRRFEGTPEARPMDPGGWRVALREVRP